MSNMACATCGKVNEWSPCKKCDGAGAVAVEGWNGMDVDDCPDCHGEGGKWVCDCDRARAAVGAGLELKGE
jgi:hypothetical protein